MDASSHYRRRVSYGSVTMPVPDSVDGAETDSIN